MVVEPRAARMPVIGAIAHHHWFVVRSEEGVERWEVWQRPLAGGGSWGYLHLNLLAPEAGVGNGGSWIVAGFGAETAQALSARLHEAPKTYPWRHAYRYWPGPNSNTFAQWVLREAVRLPWKGIGRNYRRHVEAP